MKAREIDRNLMLNAKPKVLSEEEQTWDEIEMLEKQEDAKIKILWHSNVPGSGAPECLMAAAIRDVENRGLNVERAEALLPEGLKAYENGDMVNLNRITSLIFYELNSAERNEESPYWQYKIYESWDDYLKRASFPEPAAYDLDSEQFRRAVSAGWTAQICGGGIGTAIEGYTTDNIREVFGEIYDYVRKPNTFNDDITFELAFLKAFEKYGSNVSSKDIAEMWIGHIPFGWSAEDAALRNIRYGIYPPLSGSFNNPFREWIGAQMRGAVCGMVAPGNPKEAARLAWIDGVISHHNNGVIGEIFNAVLVSMSFVEKDVRKLLKKTIDTVPEDSEYYSVVKFAFDQCQICSDWESAWAACEKRFERYNWVHAYPNAAAEVVALWYGNGNFDETMHIIAMEGQDVDCNAAQIATALGIISGSAGIGEKWTKPIGDTLYTYVREMREMKISDLAKWTVDCARKAYEG